LQVSYVIISGIRDLRLSPVRLSVDLVKEAGGKILEQIVDRKNMGEKADIPGIGIYVKCEDTEGNKFTLLESNSSMKNQK